MKKVLYLECQSGISGDMMVAALLDLGADRAAMEQALNSLPVSGFRTEVSRVVKSGLDVCDFAVILDAEHENHDHDMEYLHGDGHSHGHSHEYDHTHEHTHAHDHEHTHAHGHTHTHGDGTVHTHEHRTLPGILHILSHGDMTDSAGALAGKIFEILADAEAKAHGIPREQVHFHEVGAVDSIVDITAAAVLLDSLGIEDVVIPELCEGRGWVRCQHGVIPVPVPAVVNIAAEHGLTLHRIDQEGELVTPTGAAIAAAIRTSEELPARYRIAKVGIGAGKRKYERPSLLRAMILEVPTAEAADEPDGKKLMKLPSVNQETQDCIMKLETNIDDCTGENLGYVMELLLEAGARDVHYHPVFMKKNRPAYQLNVICSPEDTEKMEDIIFGETTTIGIRRIRMERTVLAREMVTVETHWGTIRLKQCRKGDLVKAYPEYEDLKAICKRERVPYSEVYHAAMEAWMEQS